MGLDVTQTIQDIISTNKRINTEIKTTSDLKETVSKLTIDPKVETTNRDKLLRDISDTNFTNDPIMRKLLHYNGIYEKSAVNLYGNFSRWGRLDPYNLVNTTREYVFFTKPDLNIFKSTGNLNSGIREDNGKNFSDLNKNAFFSFMMHHGYENVLYELQHDFGPYPFDSNPFITLLFNRRTSNMDLSDISSDEVETNSNYFGTKFKYRRGTEKSDEEQDFSVEFEDTKNLEVYLFFKAYDEYERLKWYGLIAPQHKYIQNKVIHDQFGAFRFIVGEDGETIIHWSQFFGVFPSNVPRSAFSDMPQDGHLKFTINFKAQFVCDMDPLTISDFNLLTGYNFNTQAELPNTAPIWDDDIQAVNGENVGLPYIMRDKKNSENYTKFKLKWRKL